MKVYQYPCKDCPDRFVKVVDGKVVRCHSTCQKYLDAKEKHYMAAEVINKEKDKQDDLDDYLFRTKIRIKKTVKR